MIWDFETMIGAGCVGSVDTRAHYASGCVVGSFLGWLEGDIKRVKRFCGTRGLTPRVDARVRASCSPAPPICASDRGADYATGYTDTKRRKTGVK